MNIIGPSTPPEPQQHADELPAWRFWLIPVGLLSPTRAKLLNGHPGEKTEWGRGRAFAVCRHNKAHRPPEVGCRCGIHAMPNAADIQHAARGRRYYWDQALREVWAEATGEPVAFSAPPRSPRAQVRLMTSRGHAVVDRRSFVLHSPQTQIVLGRVKLSNAVSNDYGDDVLKTWRAESATIDSLHVEVSDAAADAGCDVERLCAALGERYGVPCTLGYPAYSQDDWDTRTNTPPLRDAWDRLGLHPPGAEPKPRRYELVEAPPREKRRPRFAG